MLDLLNKIDKIVWGDAMIIFLLGTHIFLTFKTGFIQKYVFKGIKLSISKKKDDKGELSFFGSLCTALSSTIGTGNINGTAVGIVTGGPGAIFWMWIGGIFGIATKYCESFIAVKYRVLHSNNQYSGGAMTAFEKLKMPISAKIFAILCALCAFGIGGLTQSQAISSLLYTNFNVPTHISGIVICILTALVIIGGVKSISKTCEQLVPFMSLVYVLGCIYVLFYNRAFVFDAIKLIFTSAFTTRAAIGGFIGSTVRSAASAGMARGLFSNEAGMGSSPQATAASVAPNAVKPALIASTGVFWDTVVICLVTGVVLVSSILANDQISCILNDGSIIKAAVLVSNCFAQIPLIGTPLLTFGILTFAYSTILGWSYYGENCTRYLFGHRGRAVYKVIWIIVLYFGAVGQEGAVWIIADILNALMCIPNVIVVLLLLKVVLKDTKYYLNGNKLDEVDPNIE